MGRAGAYRFDRTRGRDEVYSIDTPPPTVSGSPAHRARLLLHAHRPHRPLPADARQGRVLPDGLGRQRPAHRAPGAELLRRALRSRRCRTTRTSPPPAQAGAKPPAADLPAQLHRAVRAAHGRGREGLRGSCGARSACPSTGSRPTRPSADAPRPSRSGRSCATSRAARPTRPRRRRCGTSPSAPRSRRPSSRTGSSRRLPPRRVPPAPTAAAGRHRDHPAGADRRPASRSSPIRTTSATSRCSAPTVTTPLFGVEVPVVAAPPRRAGQGLRHRDDLHLRRHDRRRRGGASCDLPTRTIIGRDGRIAAPTTPGVARRREPRRPRTRELAGKTLSAAQDADRRTAAREPAT